MQVEIEFRAEKKIYSVEGYNILIDTELQKDIDKIITVPQENKECLTNNKIFIVNIVTELDLTPNVGFDLLPWIKMMKKHTYLTHIHIKSIEEGFYTEAFVHQSGVLYHRRIQRKKHLPIVQSYT